MTTEPEDTDVEQETVPETVDPAIADVKRMWDDSLWHRDPGRDV